MNQASAIAIAALHSGTAIAKTTGKIPSCRMLASRRQTLIDQAAKKLAGEFFKSFSEIVGPAQDGDDDAKTEKKAGFFKRLLGKS